MTRDPNAQPSSKRGNADCASEEIKASLDYDLGFHLNEFKLRGKSFFICQKCEKVVEAKTVNKTWRPWCHSCDEKLKVDASKFVDFVKTVNNDKKKAHRIISGQAVKSLRTNMETQYRDRVRAERAAENLRKLLKAKYDEMAKANKKSRRTAEDLREQLEAKDGDKEEALRTAEDLREQLKAKDVEKEKAILTAKGLHEQLMANDAKKEEAFLTAEGLREQLKAKDEEAFLTSEGLIGQLNAKDAEKTEVLLTVNSLRTQLLVRDGEKADALQAVEKLREDLDTKDGEKKKALFIQNKDFNEQILSVQRQFNTYMKRKEDAAVGFREERDRLQKDLDATDDHQATIFQLNCEVEALREKLEKLEDTSLDGKRKHPEHQKSPKPEAKRTRSHVPNKRETRSQNEPQDEMKVCHKLLLLISSKDASCGGYFAKPVDPVKLKIPTYFHVIKKPMDLQTLKKKMTTKEIDSIAEFSELMHLIFKNAVKFNQKETKVYNAAESMLTYFDSLVKEATIASASPSKASSTKVPEKKSPLEASSTKVPGKKSPSKASSTNVHGQGYRIVPEFIGIGRKDQVKHLKLKDNIEGSFLNCGLVKDGSRVLLILLNKGEEEKLQCPYCAKYFSPKGFSMHIKNCQKKPDP